jgi:hypothetical protein
MTPPVGAGADLSHLPIGDCARANALRVASGMNFGAFLLAHCKPSARRKSASASTVCTTHAERELMRLSSHRVST